MAYISICEEERIILSTIYEFVAQYPALKYDYILYHNSNHTHIRVEKIFVLEDTITVHIGYWTTNNKEIIAFELNLNTNTVNFNNDADREFIRDIMFLPSVVNYKFIETYKGKDLSIFANNLRECYSLRISRGYDLWYRFLFIFSDMFSDVNDSALFSADAMFLAEESAIRFLKNGSICIIDRNQTNKYNKNIGFLPLYLMEYFIQGYYLNALQVQSDVEEFRRQSEENVDNWIAVNG